MPNPAPEISVLMPVKDESLYLEDCLISIINQSFENWECIVIDDSSMDNTPDILESFSKTDKRIKWYRNEGKGIIPALQMAYKKSTGKFLTRMDGDDLMPKEKLKLLYQKLIHSDAQISTGLVKYFPENEINEGYQKYQNWLNDIQVRDLHYEEIYRECVVASPNWLISREDFDAAGAFFSDIYPEDYELVFRWYKKQFKIEAVQEITHLWRDHPKRVSRTHQHYKDQHFFDLKFRYFLELDYREDKELILWGAGLKGKLGAKILKRNNIKFRWCCNNENKVGHIVNGVKMEYFDIVENPIKPIQIIVAVSQRNQGDSISEYFSRLGFQKMKDYYFFC
ncbi:MAG: glycosyltransferase family 2 protein [Chitinophagaceae bacterium]|nr:MAG: glycosyltransferase family 2 protein [Chitinophagaceae bacterium]